MYNFQTDYVHKFPLFYKVSNYFRNKRFNLFLKLLSVQRDTPILDVGGTFAFWENLGFENVTLLNVDKNVSDSKIKSIQYGGGGEISF